jgi:hypothetical protein
MAAFGLDTGALLTISVDQGESIFIAFGSHLYFIGRFTAPASELTPLSLAVLPHRCGCPRKVEGDTGPKGASGFKREVSFAMIILPETIVQPKGRKEAEL